MNITFDTVVAAFRKGEYERALNTSWRLLALDPAEGRNLLLNIRIEWFLDHASDVIRKLDRALRIDPLDPVATRTAAELAVQVYIGSAPFGEEAVSAERAFAIAKRTLCLNPSEPAGYRLLGQILQQRNERREAAHSYRRSLAVAPQQANVHVLLGQVMSEQPLAALSIYEAALRLRPQQFSVLLEAWSGRSDSLLSLLRTPFTRGGPAAGSLEGKPLRVVSVDSMRTVDASELSAYPNEEVVAQVLPIERYAVTRPSHFDAARPRYELINGPHYKGFEKLTVNARWQDGQAAWPTHFGSSGMYIASLPDAHVLFDCPFTRNHELVEECSNFYQFVYSGKLALGYDRALGQLSATLRNCGNPVQVDGSALLVTAPAAKNYWHWMTDVMPRLRAYLDRGLLHDSRLLLNAEVSRMGYVTECLKAVGVSDDRIVWLEGPAQVERLYVAFQRSVVDVAPSSMEWLVTTLKGHFQISPGRGTRRLFVSRRDAGARRILNEERIIEALEPYGFTTVTLSGMTLKEQIEIFGDAEIVVAPHGAGLANTLFSPPSVRIIELAPSEQVSPACYVLASARGIAEYRIITAVQSQGAQNDFIIDESQLCRALKEMLR